MIAGDLLGERARLTPEKMALIEVRSGRRFTYGDLNRRANAMARAWSDYGAKATASGSSRRTASNM